MRTTATYDHNSKQIIIHTPDREASKWWVGNLGKHATHMVLAAQLIVKSVNHGLHFFVVPIRDTTTHETFPNIIVTDIGSKNGWNILDHGSIRFNHYKIPKEYLLSKYQDIDDNGNYQLKVANPRVRFGLTLGALSGGRVGISRLACVFTNLTLTIAIRYSHSRRQFGGTNKNNQLENQVMNYQLQQYRLLPYLACYFAYDFFSVWLYEQLFNYLDMTQTGATFDSKLAESINEEIHALSSGAKPVCSWFNRDCVQTCRETMGGHGFSSYSRIGRLKADSDPSLTYEGENNVLIQQTAKFLLSNFQRISNGKTVKSPLKSVQFFNDYEKIRNSKCEILNDIEADFTAPQLLRLLQWRCCYLLSECEAKLMESMTSSDNNTFDAWNESQVFYLHEVAKSFIHAQALQSSLDTIQKAPQESHPILLKLLKLYGSYMIVNNLESYLEGECMSPSQCKVLKASVLKQCKQLAPDSLALIDSIACPDWVVWSPFGASNGQIYKNFLAEVDKRTELAERPSYWQMLRTPIEYGSIKLEGIKQLQSKL